MTRRRWVSIVASGLAGAAVIGGLTASSGHRAATAVARPLRVGTAQVQKRTLSATTSQGGILTYRARSDGSPYSVINQARGAYTELPAPGRVIRQGQALYRVDNAPVVLLYGSTPAYRTLSAGVSGPDVAQLNADLVALGDARPVLKHARSTVFGAATTAGVEKLQAALGAAQTGTLTLGQVLFEPVAIRVTSVPTAPGTSAQPGQTVMLSTSPTREVQVALDASQQTSVAVGNRVSVTLPDSRTTSGVVSSVAKVATCPATSGSGSGAAVSGTDTCSSGSPPTILVAVTSSGSTAWGAWDQAPVQVGITTDSVRGALVVPITALLARSGGGYAVEVVDAGGPHALVPVSLGLFDDADGLVQVSGAGLHAGQHVVAPST